VKRPRLPTPEERAEWQRETARDAKFREQSGEDEAPCRPHPNPPPTGEGAAKRSISPSPNRGEVGRGAAKGTISPLSPGDLTPTDRNTARRLKRGELPIEATLDLHGMSREEAFILLKRRMQYWVSHGKRCVCIITGKGRGGEGVLKRELPRWLNEPALRSHIVAFTPAPHRLGGEGALLLLLKRGR